MDLSKPKRTILIMDDEPGIIEIVEDSILELDEFYDFNIDKVENGQLGLTKINETVYDLIITDLKMPELDGASFIEKKSSTTNKNANTPLIVITGFAKNLPDHSNIFVVDKPFEGRALKNMILLHLNSVAKTQ